MRNKTILQCLLKYYFTIVGYFKKRSFVENETYIGGQHDTYMVYKGNGIFYETRNFDAGNGFQFVKGDAVKYTTCMIGMCKWRKI